MLYFDIYFKELNQTLCEHLHTIWNQKLRFENKVFQFIILFVKNGDFEYMHNVYRTKNTRPECIFLDFLQVLIMRFFATSRIFLMFLNESFVISVC